MIITNIIIIIVHGYYYCSMESILWGIAYYDARVGHRLAQGGASSEIMSCTTGPVHYQPLHRNIKSHYIILFYNIIVYY